MLPSRPCLQTPAPPPPTRPVVQPHSGHNGKVSFPGVGQGGTGGGGSNSRTQYNNNNNTNGMVIIIPGSEDVIMGRGRHNKNKPGNRKLHNLLLEYVSQYEAADKYEKTTIAETVLKRMVDTGSRFLVREQQQTSTVDNDEKNNTDVASIRSNMNNKSTTTKKKKKEQQTKKKGLWVEVTPEKARDKIAHDFRNLRSNNNAIAAAATATNSGSGISSSGSGTGPVPEKRRRS